MPATRRGGGNRGQGRPKGATGLLTRQNQSLFRAEGARRARSWWAAADRLHRTGQGPPPGPRPPRDDDKAAVWLAFAVTLPLALKGDAHAAIALIEQMFGRPRLQVEHGGMEDAPPIPVEQKVVGDVVYRCVVPRRDARTPA